MPSSKGVNIYFNQKWLAPCQLGNPSLANSMPTLAQHKHDMVGPILDQQPTPTYIIM